MPRSTMTNASFSTIPRCFATCSLGNASDPLVARLEALSNAGFTQIELSMPDLVEYANQNLPAARDGKVSDRDYDQLEEAARKVKDECDRLHLTVFILQPFGNFEGWPQGSDESRDAFERLEGWIRIMKACGTDMLQVGSSDSEGITTDRDAIVRDLAELCDRLAREGFKVAYENWCWSTHAPTWASVWNIVKAVREQEGKDNIGLCLDSFQTAGSEWADPTSDDGLVGDEDRDARLDQSMEALVNTVEPGMIYFFQVSDAYRVEPPLEDKVVDGLRPRGRWSHDHRPLPYEGGYLPVAKVTKAILKTGFRGTFSVEVFDGKSRGVSHDDYAQRAKVSLEKLLDECAEEGLGK
ncbi:hypothetical protein JCM10212_004689 [Sporobolomyces blumeae]